MGARRWSAALWGLSLLALVGLLAWCLALPARTPPVFPDGDPAIIELYTWHASHGLWEYGPYSRFGWHHPGPLYFYLLAPFYIAGGQHTLALDAGALALNLATLTIVAWGLTRFAGRLTAAATLVVLSLYLFQIARLLTSVWNPHVLLVPFAALLVTAAIVMAGRLSLLPLTVAIGSFAAQTHVGLVPCVTVICAAALTGGLLRTPRARSPGSPQSPESPTSSQSPQTPRSPESRPWVWLAVSAAVIGLLWFPSIFEQLTATTGNATAIAHFFGPSGPNDADISFGDALAVWSETLTAPARVDVTVPYGNDIPLRYGWFCPALAVAELILLGLVAWRSHLQDRKTESSLALLCALASLVALVSIARIRGGVPDHLVGWVTVLGTLNVGVIIGAALTGIDERRTRLSSIVAASPLASAVVPLASLALVVAVAWYGGARIEWLRQEHIRKSTAGRTPTQALYQELRSTLAKTRIRKPLIHGAALSWPQAAGIGLQLTKQDIPFASDLTWLFGPQVAPRGDEDATVTIADTPTRHALTQQPGDCMILERHGTSVHVRAVRAVPLERIAGLSCVAP
jgi:hypothetical protein